MRNEEYLIEMIAGVLNERRIAEPEDTVDLSEVFRLACSHNVQGIAFLGLEKIEAKPKTEVYKQWKEMYEKGLVKSIKQMNELSELSRLFSENQIVHLPLKGCILKKIYAKPEMRSMADLDILIEAKDQTKVRKLLEMREYVCELYGKGNHDVYKKAPIYNVEIHRELFDERLKAEVKYYSNFMQRTRSSADEYARVMRNEDFYVHNIAHFHKHFEFGGTGIRSIIDVYVIRQAFYSSMDMQYVRAELSKLGLTEFEKNISRLGDYWFGDGGHDDELDKLAAYITGSGTYGNMYNLVNNQIERYGKWKWLWRTAFLPYTDMKMIFPILKKYPVLLPFFWIWRIIISILKKPQRILFKAKVFMKRVLSD